MRKEYIEHYVNRYILRAHDNAIVLKVLPELFAQAALDPQGEAAGLQKLADALGILAVRPGACVHCGGVLADYALVQGDEPLWCHEHKPEGAVYALSKADEAKRHRNVMF
jgi:hypothetical protein